MNPGLPTIAHLKSYGVQGIYVVGENAACLKRLLYLSLIQAKAQDFVQPRLVRPASGKRGA